jgi:hypothetical protein
VSGISARLAARTRHICVFLGAGSSRAAGLPDISGLQTSVAGSLAGSDRDAYDQLVGKFGLEGTLTRLRRIAALVDGDETVNGLSAGAARRLDEEICSALVSNLGAVPTDTQAADAFAAWVARADYARPVEIFTVNYDLILESALDAAGAPYFDGFVGQQRARFRSDLVEAGDTDEYLIPPFFARVWKLHGSLSWEAAEGGIVRLGGPVLGGKSAAIFPSDAKYDESRRMPFVVLQDRLRRALYEPETLTLISGYSWSDAHLNEHFYDATARRQRSEVITFCFGDLPDELAERAIRTPNLQVVGPTEAIIGGVRGTWHEPEETHLPSDIWQDGTFRLGNFGNLASLLARVRGEDEPVPPLSEKEGADAPA